MTITKATPADTGCYANGHWGQYGSAHLVMRATEFGYDDAEAIALARKHLDAMGPSDSEGLTDDEYWILAEGDVEEWLNDNVAPEGYSFGWHEGEFYLWSDEQWNEGEA